MTPSPDQRSNRSDLPSERSGLWPLLFVLASLSSFYLLLFQRYRAYELDTPWYLSFSHNFWTNGNQSDYFLNGIFPDGMGGTQVFGRLAALLQGAFLHYAGWMPLPAMVLSTLFVLAGLALWYSFLRSAGFTATASSALILGLGLMEPFVGMAERARYEPEAFFFFALSFWLASQKRAWLALIIGLFTLEIEPAGALVAILVSLYLLWEHVPLKQLLRNGAAAVLGFAGVYFALHPHLIEILRQTNWHRGSAEHLFGGYMRAYFLLRLRHAVELPLLFAAFVMLWRFRSSAPRFVLSMGLASSLIAAFSFLLNWPNPAYMIFFFPFALVVCQWALSLRWSSPWILPAMIALLMLPQYAAVAYINRNEGYSSADIRQVSTAIQSVEKTQHWNDRDVRIMGDYSLWFAHPDQYRGLTITTSQFIQQQNIFLCYEGALIRASMTDEMVRYCSSLADQPLQEIGVITIHGHRLHILIQQDAIMR